MTYLLFVKSNVGLQIQPGGLDYFQDHFVGKPMSEDWHPPEFTVVRRRSKIHDFVGWMLAAPIMTKRAKEALSPLLGSRAQFLQFGEIKGVKLFALNVVNLRPTMEAGATEPIFKLASDPSVVFVTQPFADLCIAEKLYGVGFGRKWDLAHYLADPDLNNLNHWVH